MFESIMNFADLRKAYHAASRKAHPDMGGTTEEMQRVNADFERATKRIEDAEKRGFRGTERNEYSVADMEKYAEIMQKLVVLDGIEIEICGTWLWITGNTFAHKETLKAAGCKWSSNKKAWYWYSGEYHKVSKKKYTLDEIRDMHGSETVKARKPAGITAH